MNVFLTEPYRLNKYRPINTFNNNKPYNRKQSHVKINENDSDDDLEDDDEDDDDITDDPDDDVVYEDDNDDDGDDNNNGEGKMLCRWAS